MKAATGTEAGISISKVEGKVMRSCRGETTLWDVLIVLAGIGLLIIMVHLSSADSARGEFRKEAVIKGHAEYGIGAEGKPVWKWKDIGKCALPTVEEKP